VAVLLKPDKHFLGMASALQLWVKESQRTALLTKPITGAYGELTRG
jgi:hypothetical protein